MSIANDTSASATSSPSTPPFSDPGSTEHHSAPQTCPKPVPNSQFVGTFNTRPERSMALADQARQVAAEFEFGADAVNKAVKEFIREMGMFFIPFAGVGFGCCVRSPEG